ncbi:MAG TPA: MATE family efflux transporter [Clostridiales bacterium]|nr:MATE family efflux transporter [Clostridiales bacterium]
MIKNKAENSLLKSFSRYVSLSILGMIGLSCYILADTYFVALGLGANGLTALNIGLPLFNFMYGTTLMIGVGGATRYAIERSKSHMQRANRAFTNSLIIAAFFAVIFVTIGIFFTDDLCIALGASGDIIPLTQSYMMVFLLLSPMYFISNLMMSFVRNDNNPRLAMIAMITGSISNIVFDYIFIFPLNMGMVGAALATGTAPLLSTIILSTHFIRKKNNFHLVKVKLKIKAFLDICALGISSLITEVSTGIVIIVFNLLILSVSGNTGVAAYGIIVNLALVVVSVFTGIAQGVQPLISRCYGTGNRHDLFKLYKYAITLAIIIATIVYAISAIFPEPIALIFNSQHNTSLTALAVEGIYIYFAAFFFTGINIISASFFSSNAKPIQALLISILRGFAIVIPLAFLFCASLGMVGIWLAMPVAEAITAIVSLVLLAIYKGHYKSAA